jgi:transposase
VKRWGLVTCCKCRRVYNRDYNAARNIFNIAAAAIFGQHAFTNKHLRREAIEQHQGIDYSRPSYLCRAPPAAAAVDAQVSSSSEDDDI